MKVFIAQKRNARPACDGFGVQRAFLIDVELMIAEKPWNCFQRIYICGVANNSLRKIPESAVRALAKVQRRLAEVEEEVAIYERRLENAADQFRAADEEWNRLNRKWEAAQVAMDNDLAARRRVEAVRRVVSRIGVTFVWTGEKRAPRPHEIGRCVPEHIG